MEFDSWYVVFFNKEALFTELFWLKNFNCDISLAKWTYEGYNWKTNVEGFFPSLNLCYGLWDETAADNICNLKNGGVTA
jgi:hypothetical protein